MEKLENLLQRYAEGTITPEEQGELDQLTRRDEIVTAATAQARDIRRRRSAIASTIAAIAIVVGVYFSFFNIETPVSGSNPLIAKAEVPAVKPPAEAVPTPLPVSETPQQTAVAPRQETCSPATATTAPQKASAPQPTTTTCDNPSATTLANSIEPTAVADPVVACNTQCSPDSVINDIWNFLKA